MTGTVLLLTCPTCGAESAPEARFCAQCGGQLPPAETGMGMPPAEGGPAEPLPSFAEPSPSHAEPSAVAAPERHVFGLAPPGLVLALAVGGLVVAIVMFAVGHWVAGVVLLLVALGLGALLASTVRQVPDGRVAQAVTRARADARGRAGLAWVSLVSWLGAGREVVRLRRARLDLRREQKALIHALGDAVYRGDLAQAAMLKGEVRARAERIEECERKLAAALAAARERVGRERRTIQPTKVFTRSGRDNPTA